MMEKTRLGNSSTEVSKMCLGTMYFGSRIDQQNAFKLMDEYYTMGGRFLDTSNNYVFWIKGYTGDESELTVGKWMEERNNRNEIFLATKCGVRPMGKDSTGEFIYEGISKKAIKRAIDGSLVRLGTDYIDLYYIHVDWRTEPLEETLGALNDLVQEKKVKHIACSNMSAWRLAKAKEICRNNNWAQFIGIQNWYSYLQPRHNADMWVQKFADQELLDYCQTEGNISLLPYTSTLGGLYSWDSIYDKNHPALNNRFFSEDNERRLKVLHKIADERNSSPFQVMFAWMLAHNISIIPILGVRTIGQLKDNLGALELSLSDGELKRLNEAAFNGRDYKNPDEVKLFQDSK